MSGRMRWFAVFILPLFILGCPEGPLDVARAQLAQNDLDAAGEAFTEAAKADPANLAAWDGAVDVWCRRKVHVGECLKVLDLELQVLGTVQRHKDALSEVLEARARARMEQGMIEPALADLARAQKAAPDRPSVYAAKARALIMLGRRQAALDALVRARNLERDHPESTQLLEQLPAEAGFGGDTAD